MAASLPWRRDEEPAQLPRLAPHSGGVGPKDHARGFYLRSHRIRPISTINAIRAISFHESCVVAMQLLAEPRWMLENCAHCVRFRLFPQPVRRLPTQAQAFWDRWR